MVLSRRIASGNGLVRQLAEDFEKAPVPESHKAMFRWVKKFVRGSREMTEANVQTARATGVEHCDVVDWAQLAALQTCFVVQADGGGVFFPDEAAIAVGQTRVWYASASEGLTAGATGPVVVPATGDSPADGICWVETDTASELFRESATRARARWGVVPNLLVATSGGRAPALLPRQLMALELLEAPQSRSLSPLLHALVRALVTSLNRSSYSTATIREQVLAAGGSLETYGRVAEDYTLHDWDPTEGVVLGFAAKAALNAYRIDARDIDAFRRVGLDDEAYLDVLATVAIQMGIDRIANSLGVRPDAQPLIEKFG